MEVLLAIKELKSLKTVPFFPSFSLITLLLKVGNRNARMLCGLPVLGAHVGTMKPCHKIFCLLYPFMDWFWSKLLFCLSWDFLTFLPPSLKKKSYASLNFTSVAEGMEISDLGVDRCMKFRKLLISSQCHPWTGSSEFERFKPYPTLKRGESLEITEVRLERKGVSQQAPIFREVLVIRPSMCSTDNHPDENLPYGLFDEGWFFDAPFEGVGKGVHQKNVSKIH